MTIAAMFAFVEQGVGHVVGLSDCRLRVQHVIGTISESVAYPFPKVFALGQRSLIAIAGETILPLFAPLESARLSLANRRRDGGRDSVWTDAMVFYHAAKEMVHSAHAAPELDVNPELRTKLKYEALIGGLLSNGRPRVYKLVVNAQSAWLFRAPLVSDYFLEAIGDPAEAQIVFEAGRDAAVGRLGTSVASAIWDSSNHAGVPSTGMGICVGAVRSDVGELTWPVVECAGRRFFRGIELPPDAHAQTELPYDPSVYAAAERRVSERGAPPNFSRPTLVLDDGPMQIQMPIDEPEELERILPD